MLYSEDGFLSMMRNAWFVPDMLLSLMVKVVHVNISFAVVGKK